MAPDLDALVQRLLPRLRAHLRPRAIGARVYNNADLTIATATATALTFNSERWDDAAIHSTSTNTGRLTVPAPGRYSVGAHVRFASNATGFRVVYLYVNSTLIAIDARPAVNGGPTDISITTEWEAAAGDYFTVQVYQSSGGNLAVTAAGNYSPEFWVALR